jgi:hypothetical protein
MHASLLASLLFFAAPSAEPAAMVLTTKGEVSFERGKDAPKRLGAMAILRPDDRIAVPEGGEVTLMFLHDGQRERIKPKTRATIGAKGAQPAGAVERIDGPKLAAANLESLRDLAKSGRSAGVVFRTGETAKSDWIATPIFGATVQTLRPTLTWPDAKAEAYLVQFYTGAQGKDQKLLWRATVKEPRLPYPEDKKPLEFGRKYQWRVIPLKGEDASADPIVDSKFLVLTESEITLLSKLKPLLVSKASADLLLAAVSYEAHGVYDEALRLYERLAELSPQEANFQIALASYYDRAGRKDLAQRARERAKKLGAGTPK